MSLVIRKKSASTWEHIKGGENIILSRGSFRIQNNEFELTEISGVDQFDQTRTPLTEITLYDDTVGGSAEVFSTATSFVDRLKALQYPFFKPSDVNSAVWGDIEGDILNQTDLIDYINENAGGTPAEKNPVQNEYDDIADMLSKQAEQDFQFFQYVLDASADPTVTSGDAYYEKLNTSTASLGDYRKLADEEVTILNNSRGFKVFTVSERQDDTTPLTTIRGGRIGLEYDTNDNLITGLFLNRRYTDIIENIITRDATFDYVVHLYNQGQRKYHILKVTGFATVNTNFTLVSVEKFTNISNFLLNDRVEVNFDIDVEGGGGGATLEQSVNQVAHGLVVGDWIRLDGASWVKGQADSAVNAPVLGVVKSVEDADNFTYQYGGLIALAGLTDGTSYFLSADTAGAMTSTAPTTVGQINQVLGTETPNGFLIEIGQGVLIQAPSGGSTIPVSKTGTTIEFTEDALYNEITYLTTGNLTLDLTGAVKGVVSAVFCDSYIPTITGDYLTTAGSPDSNSLNVYSFFYDGTNVYLNIGKVPVLIAPTLSIVAGDEQLTVSWSATDNASNYVVERALDSGFTTGLTEVFNGSLLSFIDTGLTNGTTYYYRGKSEGDGTVNSDFGATASDAPELPDYVTGLVAAYEFNNNLLDYTANNNDGTGVGTIAYTTGLINNALRLQNNDSYVTVPNSTDFNFGSGDFSWVCLVRFTSIPFQANCLSSKRGGTSGDREFYLFYNGAASRYNFVLYTDDSNLVNIPYSTTPTLSQWYVVGVTSNGTATGTKIYLDGIEVADGVGNETGTYTGMPTTTNDVYMGADQVAPTTSDIDGDFNRQFFWKGREMNASEMLDISNRLLAGTEILP